MRKLMLAGAVALVGAAPPPAERVVSGDGVTEVTVDGRPVRLRVEPGAQGLPVVSADTAERLGLKGGGMLGFGVAYMIGKEHVVGRTVVTRVGWSAGAKPVKRRVGWMSRAYRLAADGTVGPGGVPEPVVRFVLRPARAGERTAVLPMAGGGGLFGDWGVMTGMIEVGGKPLIVRIDPWHRLSTATAPAAARLVEANGGVLTAEEARQEIAFGVERPLRVMRLARPLAVGPLSLASIAVRVTDGRGANTLPTEADDPSEVMVTAKGKAQPGSMALGADQLERCSSVVFDKPRREVRLTCL